MSAMNSTVLVVGDLMIDVVVDMPGELVRGSDMPSSISTTYGGTAANVAVWMAKANGRPRVFGAVGDDVWGQEIVQHLIQFSVDCLVKVTDDYQTGMVIALCHPDGERSFFPDARANSALSSERVPWEDCDDVTLLYMSGYTLLNSATRAWAYELMQSARARGITVVLDPASSGPLSSVAASELRRWLQATDVLIPNQQELTVLSALVPDIHSLVGSIAAKQGADGVTLYSSAHETHIPAVCATIIDTVGAGDAFAAGLLCGLASGQSFADSAHFAVKVAAQAVSIRGAQPSASSTLAIT